MASHHNLDQAQPEMNIQTASSINNQDAKNLIEREISVDHELSGFFNEDHVEQRLLNSKPTCFLIIGKPGVGKTTIAKRLAEEFKAELVSATELIKQCIQKQSELGKKAQDILVKGNAVPDELVARMIDEKVNSVEVQHHGYILDGFPCQSESSFDVSSQMELLKNWKMQPDFIINLRISDRDLVTRCTNLKVDPVSGMVYIKEIYAPEVKIKPKQKEKEKKDEEEEAEDEGEEEEDDLQEEQQDEFFTPLPADLIQTLVVRPEDTLPMVNDSILSFKEALLHILEDQMANMDQSYLLELDANMSPTVLMRQLLLRLDSYPVRKAFRVQRLQEPVVVDAGDEAEAGDMLNTDNSELEEVMNGLQARKCISGKFKWRKSKFSYFCPVGLKQGKTVHGRPEFAAAFLDKLYLMHSEEALKEFMKNPRPFLKPPQPQAPCKLSVLGPSYSGKTTLCQVLAKKYNARVIQMDDLIKSEMNRSRELAIESARAAAIEEATELIKSKFREKLEKEKVKKEMELAAKLLESGKFGQENPEIEVLVEEGDPASTELNDSATHMLKPENEQEYAEIELVSEKSVFLDSDGEIVVEDKHPEIIEAVERAIREASKQTISLPAVVYIRVLQAEIDRLQKERVKLNQNVGGGGWILDNFPNNNEQLNVMLEYNLLPDTFFFLHDTSDESAVIMRRWFNLNREVIEAKVNKRMSETEPSESQQQAVAESIAVEDLATLIDDSQNGLLEKIVEEDENIANGLVKQVANSLAVATRSENSTVFRQPLLELKPGEMPARSHETTEYQQELKVENELSKNLQNSILSLTGTEPSLIEINYSSADYADRAGLSKTVEEICQEAHTIIEKNYKFVATEFEGGAEEEVGEEVEEGEEEEEEDEDLEEAEEIDEEDEDENFDPSVKDKKTKFGETCHYCPVSLQTNGILIPGNPELQAKYREKVYRFSSEDNKLLFLEDPEAYLPKKNNRLHPPASRFIIIGPRGSGKSTQARLLAQKLDLFHLKFRDFLQEMIVGKSKKFLEPEREEDKEEEEEEEEEDDDDVNDMKVEKEEALLPDYTEKEELIRGYLERDEPLPTDIIDSILSQLWTSEPFKSKGFVLDGYPNNENEAAYLVEKGYYPDAIVVLKVDEEQIVKRLLPARMSKWQQRMKAKKEKKKQKIIRKKEKLQKKMQARREEEIAKYEEEKRRKEAELEANGEQDDEADEEPFDVEAIIQEEFADELGEEEVIEEANEEEVKENMITDIKNNYENQTNLIDSAKDTLQEALIPRFKIDANRRQTIVEHLLIKKLDRFINKRESLLERTYPIRTKLALKLLDFGYKQLSHFGHWCPVKLMDKQPVPPHYAEDKKPLTVLHRSHIYFLSTREARRKFCENPVIYLHQASPPPVVPFRLSVIGPPKCGKTSLANRFAKEFGCVRLSAGEAVRAILTNQPHTALASDLRQFLFKGKTVPDELTIQCIETAILDVHCQLRGYVLDSFPCTKQQVKLMTDRGLIPVKVLEIRCDIKEIMQRCIKDRTQPDRLSKSLILNDSPEIIGYKLREWKKEASFIRDWYSHEHKNLAQLDGLQSKWSLWSCSRQIAYESVQRIQLYLMRINQRQAASVAGLCVTYDEMKARTGDFGQFCPVSLALDDQLVDCSAYRNMDFVAEFQGYYYKMFSIKQLQLFLATPDAFVSPKAPRKLPPPHLLPKRLSSVEVKKQFPKQIELQGYCAVTFFEGKQRYEAIVSGSVDNAVEYMNKIYYLVDLEALEKFMKKPEVYSKLKLPNKLPPVAKKIDVLSLPITGFLEQTVAELVKKALNEVGNYKPKFPFLSPTRSGILFVAYFLKAFNSRSSEYRRKKYRQKLIFFQEKCELIDFLYKKTTLKYKEPGKNSLEFNSKYESFFALQDNTLTMNWLS